MSLACTQAIADKFDCTRNIPRVAPEKTPQRAFAWGFLLGPIGLGIYLRSWADFLIPLMLVLLGAFTNLGVTGAAIWTLCGCYGAMRVINSRKAAAEAAASTPRGADAGLFQPDMTRAALQ